VTCPKKVTTATSADSPSMEPGSTLAAGTGLTGASPGASPALRAASLQHTDGDDAASRNEPRSWLLPLPFSRPPLNQNDRKNRWDVARQRRIVMAHTWHAARAAKLPTGLDRVHVELHWRATVRRDRDSDNPAPTLKACIDALCQGTRYRGQVAFAGYGLTVDDNYRHVTSAVVIHDPGEPAGTWLEVTDMGATDV
jgi:hypothetical protein